LKLTPQKLEDVHLVPYSDYPTITAV